MNILNKYLLRQFTQYFFTVNIGFIALYLLIDFFEKFDNFSGAGKPMSLVFKYFLFSIPSVVDQLGPIFILLSGVITLGILNHSNELTALKAGGIPLKKIIQPLIIGSIVITILFLGAAQYLLPFTVSTTNQIWLEGVQGKTPIGIVRNNRYYYRGTKGFYSFLWPNNKTFNFKNFSYSTWNDNYDVDELISAQNASWDHEKNQWTLNYGQVQQIQDGKNYITKSFATRSFTFPETPVVFLTPQNQAAQSSLTDLYKQIGMTAVAYETQTAWTNFLGRISYILLGLPLLILGLPILLISYQKWGRDLSIAIPASCGLAFTAWAIWGALQSLAIAGKFSPWSAASLVHISFAALGILLLRRFDR